MQDLHLATQLHGAAATDTKAKLWIGRFPRVLTVLAPPLPGSSPEPSCKYSNKHTATLRSSSKIPRFCKGLVLFFTERLDPCGRCQPYKGLPPKKAPRTQDSSYQHHVRAARSLSRCYVTDVARCLSCAFLRLQGLFAGRSGCVWVRVCGKQRSYSDLRAGSWPAHGPAAATCCWGQTLRDLPTEELPLCLAHFLREERRERRYKEHFPATGFFSWMNFYPNVANKSQLNKATVSIHCLPGKRFQKAPQGLLVQQRTGQRNKKGMADAKSFPGKARASGCSLPTGISVKPLQLPVRNQRWKKPTSCKNTPQMHRGKTRCLPANPGYLTPAALHLMMLLCLENPDGFPRAETAAVLFNTQQQLLDAYQTHLHLGRFSLARMAAQRTEEKTVIVLSAQPCAVLLGPVGMTGTTGNWGQEQGKNTRAGHKHPETEQSEKKKRKGRDVLINNRQFVVRLLSQELYYCLLRSNSYALKPN
ncbi:hypothetical protein Anapl_06339 [Anas platyrhynchos]|uniref:Uncharacterized protein n=1 Tax=Anas platyrhynchos TaxID=8839 RepID=R0JQN0_ANAPL|nr:hypothetical protein Anapl_06339 [Anas platyrhynchos]